MIPAYAATLLKHANHEVIWNDGIAEETSFKNWLKDLAQTNPDLTVIETKTPVIKKHWRIIRHIKKTIPETKIVLVGDHVTALPEESFNNSEVDYILTGGDYDFLLLNLVNWLEEQEELRPGIWYKENGTVKNTGKFKLDHKLNDLPFIDRDLTKWRLYSEKNGNFKATPGTYTMVGRDCWWHRCIFCAWTVLYPKFRVRHPFLLLNEIGYLLENYPIKEIFDDTGTFPIGKWLEKFCKGMIERGYNKEIRLGCNMRFGALTLEQYKLMKKAGFRYLLFGLESANQKTLNKIHKHLSVYEIIKSCKNAKKAGLEPHLTIMVGYPWETKEDALRTVGLAKKLFKEGYADTLQATIVIPYPGTNLFKECKEKDLLITEDWDKYDMRRSVMKTPLSPEELKEITQSLYRVFFEVNYVFRRLISIRSLNDIKFIKRGLAKIYGHLKDFD